MLHSIYLKYVCSYHLPLSCVLVEIIGFIFRVVSLGHVVHCVSMSNFRCNSCILYESPSCYSNADLF